MSLEIRQNFDQAAFLVEQLVEAGVTFGCLEVVMNALGAHVDAQTTLNREEYLTIRNHNVVTYLEEFGLQTVAYVVMNGNIEEIEMKEMMNNHKLIFTLEGKAPPPHMIKGMLVMAFPPNEEMQGHAIALIHRDNLDRESRRELQAHDEHLLVDIQQTNMFMKIDAPTLARSLNQAYDSGFTITILFLKKKRQQ